MPKFDCTHCGAENDLNLRSREAHNGFFAFLQHCVQNWPAGLEFTPPNKEELRAWAMLRTNHRQPPFVHKFKDEAEAAALMPFIHAKIAYDKRRRVYSEAAVVDGGIAILQPKSFAWEAMPLQQEANKVIDDVTAFIEDYAGISFQDWLSLGTPRRFRDLDRLSGAA